jgi:uncharacterized Tic20 family protein
MTDTHEQESVTPGSRVYSPREDQRWAAVAHLGGILWFLPALLVFLALRKNGPKTRIESKEALNWQITLAICLVVLDLLAAIIGGIVAATAAAVGGNASSLTALLPELLLGLLWLVNIAFSVLGFVRVNAGGAYRYPFALRFIK